MVSLNIELKLYTYDWFMKKSNLLNRENNKLPDNSIKIIKNIKNKLNIRDFNNLTQDVNKKTFFKEKNHTLNEIYKNLNKITDKTYDKLSNQIFLIVENLIENEETETNVQENICKKIFDIIRNSNICCKLYAKLYNELIQKYDIFQEIFNDQLNIYLNDFKTIKYVSPNNNYDEYCNYVKHIENTKNYTLFLLQCLHYSICSLDDMMELLMYFQDQLKDTLIYKENIHENEQMIETLYIIFKEISEAGVLHEKWDFIINNHKEICKMNTDGKNKKISFKLMDINDIIDC